MVAMLLVLRLCAYLTSICMFYIVLSCLRPQNIPKNPKRPLGPQANSQRTPCPKCSGQFFMIDGCFRKIQIWIMRLAQLAPIVDIFSNHHIWSNTINEDLNLLFQRIEVLRSGKHRRTIVWRTWHDRQKLRALQTFSGWLRPDGVFPCEDNWKHHHPSEFVAFSHAAWISDVLPDPATRVVRFVSLCNAQISNLANSLPKNFESQMWLARD